MASFVHLGKALKDRRSAKSLASVFFIRHGSGSRGRDINPVVKTMRSDMIGCAGTAGHAVPIPSPSGHVRFLPIGATATKVDTTTAAVAAKQMQLNELAAVAAASTSNNTVNGNGAEKVGQGLLYGRRRKRSSETIRHDKLYLTTSDVSKREYTQTWNDFQDKRSIPTTEWGKRLSSED